ncbi:hypothetical protein [Nocardioides sp.]|uniref:hypothetical protein n=1 Tax=Nocardioides sp. TaxID=35761 RepID=UPI002CDFF69A|nr:hypothetical protein [Nocardioides sp.]HXH78725.1 hypothetical protein [Nocardioides sp.]
MRTLADFGGASDSCVSMSATGVLQKQQYSQASTSIMDNFAAAVMLMYRLMELGRCQPL